MWQVWPLPSRCLLSSLLSLSPCISLSTRTLSLALIPSNNAASLFFFFFLGISLSLSFLLSLTFTLLRSISPSVSLHLPALMQLLITNPLIFEVWLSLIWRTARGWGNKERHEQPTRSGGQRRRAKSFRAFKITRHLWHKAVSGLGSDRLKPHYPVIYSIHKRSNLVIAVTICPSVTMHVQERQGEDEWIIECADLFRVWKHTEPNTESQRSVKNAKW